MERCPEVAYSHPKRLTIGLTGIKVKTQPNRKSKNSNERSKAVFEKIIVPLDGSKLAEAALPYAEEFAAKLGSELILINVIEPNDNRSENMLRYYLGNIADDAKAGAEERLTSPGPKEVKVETRVLKGNPAEEIVSFADRMEGANIVMATHGESGITRWALGSVADKVTRATIRPVTVIRAKTSGPQVHGKCPLNTLLAPLDGSKGSEATLPYVVELAAKLKAQVTLLEILKLNYISPNMEHVDMLNSMRKEANDYLAGIANSLKQKGLEAKSEVVEALGDESEEIIKYTQKNCMDVIVMATHGRSGPRRWVLGSVTNKVLREGSSPLMIVRTPGAFTD
jgi:nucleotide-binding universal stress UspA family protein